MIISMRSRDDENGHVTLHHVISRSILSHSSLIESFVTCHFTKNVTLDHCFVPCIQKLFLNTSTKVLLQIDDSDSRSDWLSETTYMYSVT